MDTIIAIVTFMTLLLMVNFNVIMNLFGLLQDDNEFPSCAGRIRKGGVNLLIF